MNFALDSAAWVAWCEALVHFGWQAVAVAVLAAVFAWIGRRISSRVEYAALVCGMLLFPVVFASTLAWRLSLVPPSPPAPGVATRLPRAVQPMPRGITAPPGAAPRAGSPVQAIPDSNPIDAEVTLAVQEGTAAAPPFSWMAVAPWIVAAWIAGVVLMLCRLAIGFHGSRRLRRIAVPLDDPRLLEVIAEQVRRLGLRVAPLVAVCRDVAVPTVVGLVRPAVLLPMTLATGLSPRELEAILCHELAHIRRCDQFVQLVQRTIEAVFFFHPAAWWLSRRIDLVREHCCDDAVIHCGASPQVYAESLVRAAEMCIVSRRVARRATLAGLAATGRPSQLRGRVQRILGERPAVHVRLSPVAVLACVAAVAGILAAPIFVVAWPPDDEPMVEEKTEGKTEEPEKSNSKEKKERKDSVEAGYHADQSVGEWSESVNGLRARLRVRPNGEEGGTPVFWTYLDLEMTDGAGPPLTVPLDRAEWEFRVDNLHNAPKLDQFEGSKLEKGAVSLNAVELPPDSQLSLALSREAEDVPRGKAGYLTALTSSWTLPYETGSRFIFRGKLTIPESKPGHWSGTLSLRMLRLNPWTATMNAVPFRERFGEQFELSIVGRTKGRVWGTDVYADESDIATAAVHAGLVNPQQKATVILTIVKSPAEHEATSRNGVTTKGLGRAASSFILRLKKTAEAAPA